MYDRKRIFIPGQYFNILFDWLLFTNQALTPYLEKEMIRRYRRFVYEAGALNRPDKIQAKVIDDKVLAKERRKEFEISRIDRFRYRTRYFTDSGIIGSKEFVSEKYQRFKHLFYSKNEKKPKPIKGLEGMYSLKRLSEAL